MLHRRNAGDPAQFLQQVADADFLPIAATRQWELRRGEARRAEADRRIARKPESLARYAHDRIQSAVAIGIMDHRHRIIARRQRGDPQLGAARRDGALDRPAAIATIREHGRCRRDTHLQQPAAGAQLGEINLQRRERRSAPQDREQGQRRYRAPHVRTGQAPDRCRKAGPRTGNKAHNCTHIARDGADGGSR